MAGVSNSFRGRNITPAQRAPQDRANARRALGGGGRLLVLGRVAADRDACAAPAPVNLPSRRSAARPPAPPAPPAPAPGGWAMRAAAAAPAADAVTLYAPRPENAAPPLDEASEATLDRQPDEPAGAAAVPCVGAVEEHASLPHLDALFVHLDASLARLDGGASSDRLDGPEFAPPRPPQRRTLGPQNRGSAATGAAAAPWAAAAPSAEAAPWDPSASAPWDVQVSNGVFDDLFGDPRPPPAAAPVLPASKPPAASGVAAARPADGVFSGTVSNVMLYGVFVHCGRGRQGLLHHSEMLPFLHTHFLQGTLRQGDKCFVALKSEKSAGKFNFSTLKPDASGRLRAIDQASGQLRRAPDAHTRRFKLDFERSQSDAAGDRRDAQRRGRDDAADDAPGTAGAADDRRREGREPCLFDTDLPFEDAVRKLEQGRKRDEARARQVEALANSRGADDARQRDPAAHEAACQAQVLSIRQQEEARAAGRQHEAQRLAAEGRARYEDAFGRARQQGGARHESRDRALQRDEAVRAESRERALQQDEARGRAVALEEALRAEARERECLEEAQRLVSAAGERREELARREAADRRQEAADAALQRRQAELLRREAELERREDAERELEAAGADLARRDAALARRTQDLAAAARRAAPFAGSSFSRVEALLTSVGLSDSLPLFHEHEVDDSTLGCVDISDLRAMGLKVGHARKILFAVAQGAPAAAQQPPPAAEPATQQTEPALQQTEPTGGDCIICFYAAADFVALAPCGHRICLECSDHIVGPRGSHECPTCRRRVTSTLRLY